MALTEYGVNANEAVKLWSRTIWEETIKAAVMMDLVGTDTDSVVTAQEELSKSAGDRIRMPLRMALLGDGVEGDSTLENNEERLLTYTDDLIINQLRHAVRSSGEMTEQRVPWNLREQGMNGLRDWWAERLDVSIINQLSGNTAITDTKYSGHNATIAPSTTSGNTRILFGGGTSTTENSLSIGSETFSLTYIDRALLQAQVATPALRKANTPWGKKYVWIGHPRQIRDLQITNVAATVNWFTIQQAMLQGGQEKKSNGIFSGALGTYKDVILLSDNRIPAAPNTTNVFRSLFCGAQAGLMGYGKRYGNRRMSWKEKLFDFDNQLGIKAGMIWGCKKTVFNSRDHGVIVVSSYGQPV